MKPQFIIVAAVVVFVAIRLTLRQRGRRARAGAPSPSAASSSTSSSSLSLEVRRSSVLVRLFGDVGLVAQREVRERVRGRVFQIGTIIILLVVVAAIVIPTLNKNKAQPDRVGVVGALSAPLKSTLNQSVVSIGDTMTVVPEADTAAADADLRAGRVDIVIVDSKQLIVKDAPSADDVSTAAQLSRIFATTLGTIAAFQAAGLTAAQVDTLDSAKPLPVTSLQPATAHRKPSPGSIVSLDSRLHHADAVQHLDTHRRCRGEVESSCRSAVGGAAPRAVTRRKGARHRARSVDPSHPHRRRCSRLVERRRVESAAWQRTTDRARSVALAGTRLRLLLLDVRRRRLDGRAAGTNTKPCVPLEHSPYGRLRHLAHHGKHRAGRPHSSRCSLTYLRPHRLRCPHSSASAVRPGGSSPSPSC